MARTYDNVENKRIWPPIIVPRETLNKYSDIHCAGNTKKGQAAITAIFAADDETRLAAIVAETDEAYGPWKEAQDAAKAAMPAPEPKQKKEKKSKADGEVKADEKPTETVVETIEE